MKFVNFYGTILNAFKARLFPVRHLVDVCVVRMFIFLSLNEDAVLIRQKFIFLTNLIYGDAFKRKQSPKLRIPVWLNLPEIYYVITLSTTTVVPSSFLSNRLKEDGRNSS